MMKPFAAMYLNLYALYDRPDTLNFLSLNFEGPPRVRELLISDLAFALLLFPPSVDRSKVVRPVILAPLRLSL